MSRSGAENGEADSVAKRLGIVIVGCGYWGINYVRVFQELQKSQVVAVCDRRAARLREVARRFPGVAVVIDPSGGVMKKKIGDEDGILIADLSSDTLELVRCHPMRYFLPHRRPDIYR